MGKNELSLHTRKAIKALTLKLYFANNLSQLRHASIYLDHLQGGNKHQYSLQKNLHALLNTLKLVHKLSADIIKFLCGSGELVQKMRRL